MAEQQQENSNNEFDDNLALIPGYDKLSNEKQRTVRDTIYSCGLDVAQCRSVENELRQQLVDGDISPYDREAARVELSGVMRHKGHLLDENPNGQPDSYVLDPARPDLPLGGSTQHQLELMKGVESSAKWREKDSQAQKQKADKTKHEQQQQTVESHVKLGMNRDDAIKRFGGS